MKYESKLPLIGACIAAWIFAAFLYYAVIEIAGFIGWLFR